MRLGDFENCLEDLEDFSGWTLMSLEDLRTWTQWTEAGGAESMYLSSRRHDINEIGVSVNYSYRLSCL